MLLNFDCKIISLSMFWKHFIEVKFNKREQTANSRQLPKIGDTLKINNAV